MISNIVIRIAIIIFLIRRTESCTESCTSNILSKLGLSWDSNAFDVGKGIQHMIHYTVCANTAM